MNYIILKSGSDGNCSMLDNFCLIDVGITQKELNQRHIYIPHIRIAFVSHKHSDHVNLATIHRLFKEGCQLYLPQAVINQLHERYFIPYGQATVHQLESFSRKTIFIKDYKITPIPQQHQDLINYAFVVEQGHKRLLYATDLDTVHPSTLGDGLDHLGFFDILALEGNYDEVYIREFIEEVLTQYAPNTAWQNWTTAQISDWTKHHYQILPKETRSQVYRALQNYRHLSKQEARKYAQKHLKPNGIYYELHRSSQFYERPQPESEREEPLSP